MANVSLKVVVYPTLHCTDIRFNLTEVFPRASFPAIRFNGYVGRRTYLLPRNSQDTRNDLKGAVMFLCQLGKNLGVLAFIVVVFSAGASSQQPGEPAGQGSKPPDAQLDAAKTKDSKIAPKPAFTLTVKTKPILNFTLKAEKAKLSAVADELSKRLKVPVFVGAGLQRELISMEFNGLTLEPAMQLMAPAVYIDYEINTGSGKSPYPVGIFFYDSNQGEPPASAVVPSNSQSLLIEGDTEDGFGPTTDEAKKKLEEQPLRVLLQNNHLSVIAKKQPLPLVLLKIGEELGIPVDIQYQSTEVVDAEITKLSIEDVLRQLSPNIRLFLRADLLHSERRALRLVLAEPAKTTQQGS